MNLSKSNVDILERALKRAIRMTEVVGKKKKSLYNEILNRLNRFSLTK